MIAADKMEFDGLTQRIAAEPLDWDVDYAARVSLAASPVILAANGPGHKLASEAVQRVARRETVTAIVSTGFCGGLDPALRDGDIVSADEVRDENSGRRFSARQAEADAPAAVGAIVSSSRVAVTVCEKQRLRRSGAIAVEMEASAVAAEAEQMGVPFYCIRVVSDAADEAMPLDFNRYRDADGRFSRVGIGLAALRSPFQRIPALRRLQSRCRKASESLGGYLAGCRF